MPGMNEPISITNPFIVALFHHRILVQAWWLLMGAVALTVVVSLWRRRVATPGLEARSRTWLRLLFGGLWLLDGYLQFQDAMPLGMANQVVAPTADGTPRWLHSLITHGITMWNEHPLALGVAVAWLQVGIGLGLLATRGRASRVFAFASVIWGVVIWVVGNAMGGVFSSTASILFGWPGAVLVYVVAGVFLAMPERVFPDRFSTVTSRFLSVVLAIGAAQQCLPDRGFWRSGAGNALSQMGSAMASAPQPGWLAAIVRHGARAIGDLGPAGNLLVILWLVVTAWGLWRAPMTWWRWPTRSLVVGGLVWWVLAQDVAVFGGLGTDCNSWPPLVFLALAASPTRRSAAPAHLPGAGRLRVTTGHVVASLGVAALVLGLVGSTVAVSTAAENTWYLAQNGGYSLVDIPAPAFTLTDTHGQLTHVGASGTWTMLTFLDPKCWTDCPLLAAQVAQVARDTTGAKVDVVAVAANTYHHRDRDLRHFIATYGLRDTPRFHFLNGTTAQLQAVWSSYGIEVAMKPTDKMSIHSDSVFVIAPNGRLRAVIPDDPGSGGAQTASSVTALEQALRDCGVRW